MNGIEWTIHWQFGGRLVFVSVHRRSSTSQQLKYAQEVLPQLWSEIPDVIAFAQKFSRTQLQGFWAAYDKAGIPDSPLDVHGIYIGYPDELPTFDVGQNFSFRSPYRHREVDGSFREDPIISEIPDLPDRYHIKVTRLGEKAFQSEA